jgi:hypothetical protein
LVSYEKEKYIGNKIIKFLTITGLINNTFKPNKVQKGTRIKLSTTMALPMLLYCSETWTVKWRQIQTNSSVNEVYVKDCKIYLEGSQNQWRNIKQTSILDKITGYKNDWIQHVNRIPRSRLPNLLTKYAPRSKRNRNWPLNRLLEEWDRNGPAMAYFPVHETMMTSILKLKFSTNHIAAFDTKVSVSWLWLRIWCFSTHRYKQLPLEYVLHVWNTPSNMPWIQLRFVGIIFGLRKSKQFYSCHMMRFFRY